MINLTGKKGLVVGIANDHSIAWGCAQAFRETGARLAITYLNTKAEPYVRPLAEAASAELILPCDVQHEGELEAVFSAIEKHWGSLDFVLHSIAFAPKADLHGRVTDCSREGFLQAMDISCHSFLRMAKLSEPLMKQGGSLLTVSYMGSAEVVKHYGLMGPVKAALEASVRYMAAELGEKNIRVNAISPGAILTRAASGIEGFEELLQDYRQKAPLHRLIDLADAGAMAAFLVSDLAKNITGRIHIIDGGYEIVD